MKIITKEMIYKITSTAMMSAIKGDKLKKCVLRAAIYNMTNPLPSIQPERCGNLFLINIEEAIAAIPVINPTSTGINWFRFSN